MFFTERTALVAFRHAAVIGLLSVAACSGGSANVGGTGGMAGNVGAADEEWILLFNGTDLEGWTVSPGAEALFDVAMIDGSPVMHVYPTQPDQSNQASATIRTNESYSSYVSTWSTSGARTQAWPESLEFQIGSQDWPGDWVTGNIFMLINKTRAQWSYTTEWADLYLRDVKIKLLD
jgi:hypothetical protein